MKSNQCKCTQDQTTGWSEVKCCNICGLPIQEEDWDFHEATIYANQKLVEFVNWCRSENFHIPKSMIGQFNLSQKS